MDFAVAQHTVYVQVIHPEQPSEVQLLKKLGEYFSPTDQHVKDLELNFTPTKQHDFPIFS